MNRILDLKKFIDAQHDANIDVAQTELIEVYRASHSSFGVRPQILVGSDRAITAFLTKFYGGEPNWNEEVFIQIDNEDNDSLVRVLRSVDLKSFTLHLI